MLKYCSYDSLSLCCHILCQEVKHSMLDFFNKNHKRALFYHIELSLRMIKTIWHQVKTRTKMVISLHSVETDVN